MTDSTWQKVREIFDSALRRKPEERRKFVNEACGDDRTLLTEVESLLSSLDDADRFLETPLVAEAADLFAGNGKILEMGQSLGHYEIIKQLGTGGMGEVYLAKDKKLDRQVAVKILNEKFSKDGSNLNRFVREAKAASALNHPNILVIHEIGDSDKTHYIVSEFINGDTLRETFKSKTLELAEVLDIAIQIANALCAAHEARLIHRDIKPENIMIRPDGLVKVLDFGLAKLVEQKNRSVLGLGDSTELQNHTARGVIMGTVNYMSPEQARGKKVDERTDIFSLGVVLYEMITGKAPFAGDSVLETFAKLIEHEPEPIRNYVSGVPDEIVQIISKMLEKAPENRYQSVREAADDMKAINSSLSGSSLKRSPQRISENRTAIMQESTRGGANTTAENTESRGRWYRRWPLMVAFGVLLLGSIGLGGYFLLQRALLSSNEIRSVAVMPFVNETGDPQVEYLSDGMTDTLISSLSELPNLKVKSRTSVFRYKGKEIDPKTIGKELSVQAIVNGRVTQRDGRTNVLLEVVDAETEDVIFSTKYDKPQSELVSLQSDIARDVSGKLRSKLSGAEEAKVTKTHTADPQALQQSHDRNLHVDKMRTRRRLARATLTQGATCRSRSGDFRSWRARSDDRTAWR